MARFGLGAATRRDLVSRSGRWLRRRRATLVPIVSPATCSPRFSPPVPPATPMDSPRGGGLAPTATTARTKEALHVPVLELVPNPDSATVRRSGKHRLWTASRQTDHVLAEAAAKLERKGLDLIVANDVTQPDAGFEVDTNRVTLLARCEEPLVLPLLSKTEVADRILDWIERHRRSPRPDVPPG